MITTHDRSGSDTSGSTLTPLGPGGRPLARWRGVLVIVTLLALVAVVALLLSERAPGAVGEVTDRVSGRLTSEAPETSAQARRALDRTGIDEADTIAHIAMWGTVTVLVALTMWSWRSLVVALMVIVVVSTGVELIQETIAPSRITEWRDVGANLVGITGGAIVAVVLSFVVGLPARARQRS